MGKAACAQAVAALLSGCGGASSDASSPAAADGVDVDTGVADSANATQMSAAATTAADTAVLSAQAVLAAGATVSSSDDRATALSARASAPVSTTSARSGAGGGTATVSIAGGTIARELNGKFDPGEVDQISFVACSGVAGAATVDGSLTSRVAPLPPATAATARSACR